MKLRRNEKEIYTIIIKKRLKRIKKHSWKHKTSSRRRSDRINAPEKFYLDDKISRKLLLNFVCRIRRASLSGKIVKISFHDTKVLHPCGTLFFVSNVINIIEKNHCTIQCGYPKDNTVEQLFQHIGLLKLFGLQERLKISSNNVKNWHFLTGVSVDPTDLSIIFDEYKEFINEEKSSDLYGVITEAITNTIQHAYPDESTEKRWWIFSQQMDNKLFIAIYDHGMGIPESLAPKLLDNITYGKRYGRDAMMIKIAVSSDRTRTKLDYMRKGLPEMLEFAKRSETGGFVIHSLSGGYKYNSRQKTEDQRKYKENIKGTLIQWEIKIDMESK
jgi:anti-sigma regulatory factor (Ser/Thr protein kinase)